MLMFIPTTKDDLKYQGYKTTVYQIGDSKISGFPDDTPFDKFEVEEVLYIINEVRSKLTILNPIYVDIMERFIRLFMPKHIVTQIQAFNWIILALDYSEL